MKQVIDKRNTDVAVNKNLLIEMDPEVAEIYAASTAVSSKLNFILNAYLSELTYFSNIASKGIGANMLKVGTKDAEPPNKSRLREKRQQSRRLHYRRDLQMLSGWRQRQ